MNEGTRRPRRPIARTTATLIVTASLTLLAAACGGSPGSHVPQPGSATTKSSTSSAAAAQNGLLAFSHCMRSHGVPDFPDPNGRGVLPKSLIVEAAASSPQFPAAHRSCGHLLPNGGQPTQAQAQQAWNDMRNFARCMRSHGVPNWPDPAPTSPQDPRPFFHLPSSMDPNAPQLVTRIRACQHVLHASNPLVTTQ